MGEVYLARDSVLDREVAVKLLPSEMASDPERLARFEREARVLASLNHPGIVSIHSLETFGDTRFLVMELIRGDKLSDVLKRTRLPLGSSLEIAAEANSESAEQAAQSLARQNWLDLEIRLEDRTSMIAGQR